jgi:hypothetical protein
VRGKKLPGAKQSFRKIPNGVPGVETRLPLLFSEGVNKGRLTLQQFVALARPMPPRSTACIRARARSRSAPTPTSCCGTPSAR